MVQRLSVHPSAPAPGTTITICYDFASPSDGAVVLTIDWEPDALPDGTPTLFPDAPCVTVQVPSSATSVVLTAAGSDPLSILFSTLA